MNTKCSQLTITYRSVETLKDNPHNSRTHSKRQIRQIANSIESFGFANPVLLDETNRIIAGHGRVSAAKLLGIAEIPTIRLGDLSPDQVRAYVIADNKLAANIREWKDRLHEVTVLENGYEYDNRTYRSLSEIAHLITGTKWSGPAFFGCKRPSRKALA